MIWSDLEYTIQEHLAM